MMPPMTYGPGESHTSRMAYHRLSTRAATALIARAVLAGAGVAWLELASDHRSAKALLGASAGDTVEISTPKRTRRLEILSIG